MLDITLLRKDLDAVVARLATRKNPQPYLDVEAFRRLEAERKTIQTRTEELQAQRNALSKQIGQLKAKGESADAVMAQVAAMKQELEQSAARLDQIQPEMQALLLAVPNLPHESVPVGADETDNLLLRQWGTPKTFGFAVKDHVDIGERIASTLQPASNSLARALLSCKVKLPACTERWRSSCWMCKPKSTATPSATRPISSTPRVCVARASCPSLKKICLPPKRVAKTAMLMAKPCT
jgi:hypothetical protein